MNWPMPVWALEKGRAADSKEQQGMVSEEFTKQTRVELGAGAFPFESAFGCLLQAAVIPALRWSKTHHSGLVAVTSVESFSSCSGMLWRTLGRVCGHNWAGNGASPTFLAVWNHCIDFITYNLQETLPKFRGKSASFFILFFFLLQKRPWRGLKGKTSNEEVQAVINSVKTRVRLAVR